MKIYLNNGKSIDIDIEDAILTAASHMQKEAGILDSAAGLFKSFRTRGAALMSSMKASKPVTWGANKLTSGVNAAMSHNTIGPYARYFARPAVRNQLGNSAMAGAALGGIHGAASEDGTMLGGAIRGAGLGLGVGVGARAIGHFQGGNKLNTLFRSR